VIWKFRKSPMTISSELHEKVARSCTPINVVSSEVVAIRHPLEKKPKKDKNQTKWTKISGY
jgi:hypothetical protein